MAKVKHTMKNPERLEDILSRYNPVGDFGAMGKQGEVIFRKVATNKVERLHPAGYSDCVIKSGVSVEVKTGAGELETFGFDTKEEAQEALDNDRFLLGCTHVAYLPKFTGENVEDFIIVPRKRFIKILRHYGLLRVKKASSGKWKVTIQNYLPTPNFHPSAEKVGCLIEALEENGLYLDLFIQKMVKRDLYL